MSGPREPICTMCGRTHKRVSNALFCWDCVKKRAKESGACEARRVTSAAVQNGRLPHPKSLTCADCGKPAFGYDHRDYNQPLAVEPVCASCNTLRRSGKWVRHEPAPRWMPRGDRAA